MSTPIMSILNFGNFFITIIYKREFTKKKQKNKTKYVNFGLYTSDELGHNGHW